MGVMAVSLVAVSLVTEAFVAVVFESGGGDRRHPAQTGLEAGEREQAYNLGGTLAAILMQ
ncbi:hypothetical protein BST43_11530 [Mycobacteroides saopaulense]|uniref:Uncharacterized protein n=2 Tax=Mycobacteroides saopaulense TaxID=1578165 RepID=A0A1X0J741_9MYCO|nr:hypothetical protein BST43_11530 [Mycobacteroides saopaulense]